MLPPKDGFNAWFEKFHATLKEYRIVVSDFDKESWLGYFYEGWNPHTVARLVAERGHPAKKRVTS